MLIYSPAAKWHHLAPQWVFQVWGFQVTYFRTVWIQEQFNAIWPHTSVSTLSQEMSCCLTASSHHVTHCWLFISEACGWVQFHNECLRGNSVWCVWIIYFANYCHVSRGPWVKQTRYETDQIDGNPLVSLLLLTISCKDNAQFRRVCCGIRCKLWSIMHI